MGSLAPDLRSFGMKPQPFVKTAKQVEAIDLMNRHLHTLLVGGSRSAKTVTSIRNIILRGLKRPSRHLATRFRFNHAKTSLWYDTIPWVFANCFPGLSYKQNKSDWFITFPAANKQGYSEIWIGGVDDNERLEKVLGNEYSTIFANECSQISWAGITILQTRLAENSGLDLKFYYDENPPTKRHWSYQYFFKGVMPGTDEPHGIKVASLIMNPKDNLANLPPEYLNMLDNLPKKERDRFFLGLFATGVEGALWDDSMIEGAHLVKPGVPIRTLIALDPTVSNSKEADECGIVAGSIDDLGQGIVHEDLSGQLTTKQWAERAIGAYHHYEANAIVAEVNQGGQLVEDVIKNIDKSVKVIKVHAAKGKYARAEPVSSLYEQAKICHEDHDGSLHDLEDQLTSYVPSTATYSPGRLDALVWLFTELMVKPKKPREVRALVIGG